MTTLREYQMQERQLRSTLEMTKQFVSNFKEGVDEGQVDVRLSMLDDALAKYYVVRRKIDVLTDVMEVEAAGTEKDEKNKAAWEFENMFCELKAKLLAKRPKEEVINQPPTHEMPAQTTSTVSRVKLPEIKLPSFGGKTTEWITFRDSFKSLIHNSDNLSEFDKFTYLRSSLFGEALLEINAVDVSAANYQVAWNMLEKRYENKKLILKSHLDALFAVEPVRKECFEALNHLLNTFDKNLQMIDKLGVNTEDWSILLAHIVSSKLDVATLRHWEEHCKASKDFVRYETLTEFIRGQCGVLQTIAPMVKPVHVERRMPKYVSSYGVSTESSGCCFCNGSAHNVFQCVAAKQMSCADRLDAVKRNRLCFNCLQSGHVVEKCTRGFCSVCKRKHHTLLHEIFAPRSNAAGARPIASRPPQGNTQHSQSTQHKQQSQTRHTPTQSTQNPTQTSTPQSSKPTTEPTAACNLSSSLAPSREEEVREVLLSTAVVRIRDSQGHTLFARALLDSGSQRNLMTKEFARKLRSKPQSDYLRVKGIGVAETVSTFAVSVTVRPRSAQISDFAGVMRFHVLEKVSANLPFNNVDVEQLRIPENVKLADPHFYRPGPVDMIIGAEHYYDLLSEGRLRLEGTSPTIQNTLLGWVWSGVANGVSAKLVRVVAHQSSAEAAINDLRSTNPFVANRVSEIQLKGCFWHHVPGVENPADLLSRGMTPALLAYASLWWNGPAWLRQSPSTWPQTGNLTQTELDAALCRRIDHNARVVNRNRRKTGFITHAEHKQALLDLVRLVQKERFPQEIADLEMKGDFRETSKLNAFNPRLVEGVMLVGGRQQKAAVAEPDLSELPENRLSAWQKTQGFVQQIWKKWSTQYLSDLHNRTRWTRRRNNLSQGTMVLPPQMWHLGRVIDTRTGSDGNVRVVVVKTKDGIYERGISKICILPIADNLSASQDEN